jgi:hypothetical protein
VYYVVRSEYTDLTRAAAYSFYRALRDCFRTHDVPYVHAYDGFEEAYPDVDGVHMARGLHGLEALKMGGVPAYMVVHPQVLWGFEPLDDTALSDVETTSTPLLRLWRVWGPALAKMSVGDRESLGLLIENSPPEEHGFLFSLLLAIVAARDLPSAVLCGPVVVDPAQAPSLAAEPRTQK